MRERNVEIARGAIAAYNDGDIDAVLAVAFDELDLVSTPEMPNSGHFHGPDGFIRWLTQWLEAWDEHRLELLAIEALDDRHVVADVRQIGRGAHSGIEIDMTVIHLYEIDADGKIVRFQLHLHRDAALAAV
ncbi:MAG TPA: nuclear transport factor 2 family protein [Solirubrobacteraceae bacterium]|jgi:ketosteroid isomerase-like protein|nr:nuclear transport factor 2 family protein [Solirubrobacteraceae bacterium]